MGQMANEAAADRFIYEFGHEIIAKIGIKAPFVVSQALAMHDVFMTVHLFVRVHVENDYEQELMTPDVLFGPDFSDGDIVVILNGLGIENGDSRRLYERVQRMRNRTLQRY